MFSNLEQTSETTVSVALRATRAIPHPAAPVRDLGVHLDMNFSGLRRVALDLRSLERERSTTTQAVCVCVCAEAVSGMRTPPTRAAAAWMPVFRVHVPHKRTSSRSALGPRRRRR